MEESRPNAIRFVAKKWADQFVAENNMPTPFETLCAETQQSLDKIVRDHVL